MITATAHGARDAEDALRSAIAQLIPPLNRERYALLQQGIFESADVAVMVNEKRDFAFLHPRPSMDYREYKPRSERLGLRPSRIGSGMRERLDKLASLFETASSVLEIGAAEASFLKEVRARFPRLSLACIEPDQKTAAERREVDGLREFCDVREARDRGDRFGIVGAFHVFEHIEEPADFLRQCASLLEPEGRLVLEVPAISDPLLSVYQLSAYQKFYFQQQHPFVYSGASLTRVLEEHDFVVDRLIPYQRYGLENHLAWLAHGRPGGDETYRRLFGGVDGEYRAALEREGFTDTVVAVARMRP